MEVVSTQEYRMAPVRYFRRPYLRSIDLRCPKFTIPDLESSKFLTSDLLAEHKNGLNVLRLASERLPQTKPVVLNHALPFARGEYLVIFDAEDQPETDQLRNAVRFFHNNPGKVACLQAHLSFFNMSENWLTRQFGIEFSAFFDVLLPISQKLRLPIRLGGTSIHFDLRVLRSIGAWDAFNLTEDADLGLRLYSHKFEVQMLDSTTYEKANKGLMNWLKQRTRWLKRWIQTYTVQMHRPIRCMQELGLRGLLGLQILFASILLSALLHPVVRGYLF